MKQPRFSIHDAFEEENDEAIRVYGSTVVSHIPRASSSGAGGVAASASNANVNTPNSAPGYVSNSTPTAGTIATTTTTTTTTTTGTTTTTTNELTCDPRFVIPHPHSMPCVLYLVFVLFCMILGIINLLPMTPHPEIVIH